MSAKKIEVSLISVSVSRKSKFWGPGEWSFNASVKKLPGGVSTKLGDDATREARVGADIALGWSTDLGLMPADSKIEINMKATDSGLLLDKNLGSVRIVLLSPISHDYQLKLVSNHKKRYFTATIRVKILERTPAATGAITTIRETIGAKEFAPIHDEMPNKLVHICPVIPVPWATGIPPIPKGVRSPAVSASSQVDDFHIDATSAGMNALINPAFIPVIPVKADDFATKCAQIRITQYRPADLDLTKIIWKAVTPNIRFMHNNVPGKTEVKGGREVKVYGIVSGDADEECKIEVRWDDAARPLLATYTATVGKIKYIWCRANIIKCTAARVGLVPLLNPTYTAADVEKHLEFTNKILWQAGLHIVMDLDETTYNGAKLLKPGIFEVSSATNHTFNVQKNRRIVAPLLNSRGGIFNLAYLHSCRGKPNLLGSATDRAISKASEKVKSTVTPSTSWVRPTGVWPDSDTQTVEMETMGPSTARADDLKPLCGDGAMDKITACIMTENCKANIATGEVTLPHELGHVIGLHHRGSGTPIGNKSRDGVNHLIGPQKDNGHPWNENLMSYGNDSQAQDIDRIQLGVIRSHPLLKDTPPVKKASPSPPKEKKTVPTAWLPDKSDIVLMQEYLGGTRAGLKNSGYDLGSGGPKNDGVDGINGPKTRSAVKSFQASHGEGLAVDGIYGPKTYAAFDKELNSDA